MLFGISYWILPIVASCTWLGGLMAMLITWAVQGKPQYPSMNQNQTIPYISDVGAGLKAVFIATSTVCVVVFDVCFISERWLRHKGRLAHNRGWVDKSLSICATIFAIAGAAGLILLSIFDTYRHNRTHNTCLAIFIGGYIISAVFVCLEKFRLGTYFREYKLLRISFWIKCVFIVVEVAMVIAFAALSANKAAIVEWIVALIYCFYVASFALDFLPALHSKHDRFPTVAERDREMGMAHANGPSVSGGPVYAEDNSARESTSSGQPLTQRAF